MTHTIRFDGIVEPGTIEHIISKLQVEIGLQKAESGFFPFVSCYCDHQLEWLLFQGGNTDSF